MSMLKLCCVFDAADCADTAWLAIDAWQTLMLFTEFSATSSAIIDVFETGLFASYKKESSEKLAGTSTVLDGDNPGMADMYNSFVWFF